MNKPIENYPLYTIYTNGTVKNNNTNRFLKPLDRRGYKAFRLYKDGESKIFSVHRLVATHFLSNPENKSQVNHVDGIKSNNDLSNLEWCTQSENIQHAYDLGLNPKRLGKANPAVVLTEGDVLAIRANPNNLSQNKLAGQYGVSQAQIGRILRRVYWTHI